MRGLYVHVPYCTARCGYCDFNTYVAPADERAGYPALAMLEIERAACAWPGPVDTVFFGGGTPTLLAPRELAAILKAIDDQFGLAPGAEVTTEANPESVDLAALSALREAGFTRVSLGIAAGAILIGAGIGTALGLAAGYLGGAVEAVIMRLADTFLAFPSVLMALVLAVAVGPSFGVVVLVLGLVLWARFARLALRLEDAMQDRHEVEEVNREPAAPWWPSPALMGVYRALSLQGEAVQRPARR